MAGRAVVVISFDRAERFQEILQTVKHVFEGDESAKVYGAVKESAQDILNLLAPAERDSND